MSAISGEPPQLKETDTVAMIKASYIYNFAKLVGWPESQKKGDFQIGVLGDPSLYQQMITKYSGKQIGSQDIEIVQLVNTEKLGKPHILFISRNNSEAIGPVVKSLTKSNTMVITEDDKGLDKGASLNFLVIDNLLKFEISETNTVQHKLTIGSTLKSLAHNRGK